MATIALATVLRKLRRSLSQSTEEGLTDCQLLERFVTARDEAAFEALLRRHGPMVLGVCRRILHNEADAEDAFQATFLVLVRKAASISPRGMVGNWLYGVAHSTALKARAMSSKRFAREREAAARRKPEAIAESREGLLEFLDQELKALSDKYRAAIVMCELEGMSIQEAAQQLGCPPGTLGSRLARGRTLLSRRLASRGVTLSGAMIAMVVSQHTTAAGVPLLLMNSTLQAAMQFAAGQAAATNIISTKVATITEGVLKSMLLKKLKIVTTVVLLFAELGAGAVGISYSMQAAEQGEPAWKVPEDPATTKGKTTEPKATQATEQRQQSAENLRTLSAALHDYRRNHGRFPPAASHDRAGKPLLSWRVLILPSLGEQKLLLKFKLDEPWDSPHNKKLLARMPAVYRPVGKSRPGEHATFYQVFTGKNTTFDGTTWLTVEDISDGTSNTVWMAEAAQAVPWTRPADLTFEENDKKPLPKLGGLFRDGFHVAVADTSIRFVKKDFDKDLLRALITRNGSEAVSVGDLGESVPAAAARKSKE
jgi:RNA polymerase sigma factor (sigma-70 family)